MSKLTDSLDSTFAESMRTEIAPVLNEFTTLELSTIGGELCEAIRTNTMLESFAGMEENDQLLVFKAAIATLMAECQSRG